jgi:hypothetical protein
MPRSYRNGLVTGLALSLGAMLLAPVLRPAVTRWGRPATKAVLKGGLVAVAAGRERVAEASETLSDMLAEAQFELAAEQAAQTPAKPEPPATAAPPPG